MIRKWCLVLFANLMLASMATANIAPPPKVDMPPWEQRYEEPDADSVAPTVPPTSDNAGRRDPRREMERYEEIAMVVGGVMVAVSVVCCGGCIVYRRRVAAGALSRVE